MKLLDSKTNLLNFFFMILAVSTNAKNVESFVVCNSESIAQLVVHSNEKALVHSAVNMFANDVFVISNLKPEIYSTSDSPYQIKVGTLGLNPDFDNECAVSGIAIERLKGKWEAYQIQVINDIKKGVKKLLVVGSNSHGTAYGLMELSRIIGVSPWVWWADVKPQKRETISLPGDLFLEDAPKVKFRGIFLNDEDWGLQPWAAKTFEPETGDIGSKTYEKIFELLLRLKANAIWPAMHPCTRAFFSYPDNIKMADKYGIWVGSSHCEPMLRNNVDEWHQWEPSTGERGHWNFDENSEQITEYWKQRVDTSANYDGIYTVGMRGIHDGSMPGGKDIDDKVEILASVLKTQRSLLADITGKEVASIPQIFCPYKEVLKLYKAGANIPEDVTIMWADDNHGYIRQLSNEEERNRTGGAGVYYHISYWGRPHDFLWLESVPVSLIWEEMFKAYQTNAKNVWIVNVGDIKPNEIGMNFFLDMAWDPEQFSAETLDSYYIKFAETQFGIQYAEEIGEILKEYFQLGFSRKPEHLGWNGVYPNTPLQEPGFSLFNNGDEAQQRIETYDRLEKHVEQLYEKMPNNLRDAFFQLVAYKVIGASNMNKKILYAYKSRVYAEQKRTTANLHAQRAKEAFEKIKKATEIYNDSISDGKWKYMMSYNPRELAVFDMPPTGNYEPIEVNAGGVIPEGCSSITDFMNMKYSLPVFNSLTDRSYFVDIFNSGREPIKWETEVEDNWVNVSETSGQTETEKRIWVTVNWELVPEGDTVRSIVQFKLNQLVYPIHIIAIKPDWEKEEKNLFVEDNGVVSIEAENYTGISKNSPDAKWQLIQGLGRENDAIASFPSTANSFRNDDIENAPELSYNFSTTSQGKAKLYFYCVPVHPINDDYKLRFAVSIDNSGPMIVNVMLKKEMDEHNPEWQKNVLNSVSIQEVDGMINKVGTHELKIKMIDPVVVIDKIEIVLGEKVDSYFGTPSTYSLKK